MTYMIARPSSLSSSTSNVEGFRDQRNAFSPEISDSDVCSQEVSESKSETSPHLQMPPRQTTLKSETSPPPDR